jgi:hypothetical protein
LRLLLLAVVCLLGCDASSKPNSEAASDATGSATNIEAPASDGEGAAAMTQVDSAGIPVVINAPDLPAGFSAWSLSPQPTLEIGLADGAPEYLMFRAFDGVILSDGRIVVANTGPFEVRYYDASGRHLASFGREGDGPSIRRFATR